MLGGVDRKKKIGSHTKKEWEDKLIQYDKCPSCKRSWSEIKPSKGQAKYHITKDHITPLSKGGTDNIDNIQPCSRHLGVFCHYPRATVPVIPA